MSDIALDELSRRLGKVPLVDVRHDYEYEDGHLPGAVLFPLEELMALGEGEIHERLGLEAGAELVVYCHSGSRSAFAAQILQRLNYDARNYVGSWSEWSRTELPTE